MTSDWSIYGIEDIVWDEFDDTYDHIMRHQDGEHVNESVVLGYSRKRPWHGIETNGGKFTDSRGPATKKVLNTKETTGFFPPLNEGRSSVLESSLSLASRKVVTASCVPECIVDGTALTSQDARVSNNFFEECNKDTEINTFCSGNPILGTVDAADHNKGFHFSVPADASHDFLENERKDRTNDLLYYDWPDVSTFEDVNELFRNCDSTFGQGSMGTGDEISWFSSPSHAIYGSEDTSRSIVQSSFSELGDLNSTMGHHGASTNIFPESDLSTIDNEKLLSLGNQSCTLVTDGENKCESALQVQADDGGIAAVIGSALNQSSNDNSLNECEKHCWGADYSSYMHISNPHAQQERRLLPHQVPLTQSTSNIKSESESNPSSFGEVSTHITSCMPQCMERFPHPLSKPPVLMVEEKIELCHRQRLHAALVSEYPHEQAASTRASTIQEKHHKTQHEIGGNNELEDISLELPAFERDSSTVQERFCMKSGISYDMSLKATSLQQLHNVTNQLDVGIKLWIRDSLYRLARNGVRRQDFTDINNDRGSILTRSQGTEESKIFAEFMGIETDQSIANLLFYRPPELATRSADDVLLRV